MEAFGTFLPLILIFVIIIAVKAIFRGLQAKKNLNKNENINLNNKKKRDKKD